jgi:hypothetical protein
MADVEKFKVTIEKVEESKEVLQKRLQDFYNVAVADNPRKLELIKEEAKRLDIKLSQLSPRERTITVCASCKRASCWQGEFYCDEYKTADIINLPLSKLKKMKLEHPCYWDKYRIKKYFGVF